MNDRREALQSLPVYQSEDAILDALRDSRVIVVEGPTGSGKTTQIPRILRRNLDVQRIGVTQPRRIAATSVAHRIAHEEGVTVGAEVGYAIRFDDQTSNRTVIKLMTDGILLMEARTDPDLGAYDVLMIDEAHERSLNIDVILGLVHSVLARRDDLKVIVSSATISPEQFQRFFAPVAGKVPLVSIPARTYPISVRYEPPYSERPSDRVEEMAEQIWNLHRDEAPGAVLAFLPGQADIRKVAGSLQERDRRRELRVMPLYARLTREEQDLVFESFEPKRKVVLATNIAETSITIPDVRFVVDSGLAKVPRFSPRTGISALREEPISRASAEQRAGRAGRTGPGKVIRLYDEDSMAGRPELTDEEILRLELSEVVLRLIDLGVRDVESFPFPTPPPRSKVRAALSLLRALGAIDSERRLTSIGKRMAPFPLSPRLARMVIEAAQRFPRVVDDVLVVGAFLSARSPLLFPEGQEEAARRAHRRFFHPLGDQAAQLGIYRAYRRANDAERFCARNFLDLEAMQFAQRAHEQLAEIAEEQGIEMEGNGPREQLVRAVAAGLADQVIRRSRGGYRTLTGIAVRLHPSSVLADDPPQFAVAAELVRHARAYAIGISGLRREWVKEINPEALSGRRGEHRETPRRPETPNSIRVGPLELEVHRYRGRPTVELFVDQLDALRGFRPGPEASQVRARVRWDEQTAFAPVALSRLPALIEAGAFPARRQAPPKRRLSDNLLEANRHRHHIERALDELLEPVSKGRGAGWLALVTNGTGGYWLDVLTHYHDAVWAAKLSLQALEDELYDGDPLRERVQAEVERLAELEARL